MLACPDRFYVGRNVKKGIIRDDSQISVLYECYGHQQGQIRAAFIFNQFGARQGCAVCRTSKQQVSRCMTQKLEKQMRHHFMVIGTEMIDAQRDCRKREIGPRRELLNVGETLTWSSERSTERGWRRKARTRSVPVVKGKAVCRELGFVVSKEAETSRKIKTKPVLQIGQ